ncbi:MAG: hypothetical protein AMK69_13640 [Nitrospira bacterium SG8_3]|nr:MAG: hypothetical protein AMK69_13640 [Nitrospira bacterium SG8_3]
MIEVRRSDLPSLIGPAVSHSENLTGRGMRVTQPFDFAQDREPFDLAQDRELVERLVERLAERQMGVFRQPKNRGMAGKRNGP